MFLLYRTHIRWFDLLFNIKTHVNIKWIVINMTNNLSRWVWIYNTNFTGHTRYNVIGWQLEDIFSCSCWFKLQYLKRAHAINVIICDKLYIFLRCIRFFCHKNSTPYHLPTHTKYHIIVINSQIVFKR